MTQVATLEAADTIRGRLERALLQEEVNLASENGRGRTEELIEEILRCYEEEALSGQAPALYSQERDHVVECGSCGGVDEARLVRPDAIFSPNGVVYENFSRAARGEFPTPPDDLLPVLSHSNPVIGYYGALARWFDYDLLKKVSELRDTRYR